MSSDFHDIEWRDGVPVSRRFDDPYYSLDNGLEETRFVFLDGVDLSNLVASKPTGPIVIGETGFGTGLNFLATWQCWQQHAPNRQLIFVSAEAYPLNREQLSKAHAHFPELADFSRQLVASWPPPAKGFHPISFDGGQIKLLLLFDDAARAFENLSASIDAWYLDGFAPARNPEMWTIELFSVMAQRSRPEARIATFTAAGFVRRGLADVGFSMRKAPGFGRKRERLLGKYQSNPPKKSQLGNNTPDWAKLTSKPDALQATIIGGGIAGASAAYALRQRGIDVSIVDDKQAASSSGLPSAILVPRFLLQDQPERRFFDAAFTYAVGHPAYQAAFSDIRGAMVRANSSDGNPRLQKIAETYGWTHDWLRLEGDCLILPRSGTIQPDDVLARMTSECLTYEAAIGSITRQDNRWAVHLAGQETTIISDILIIAAGPGSNRLLNIIDAEADDHPKVTANLGQLLLVDETETESWPEATLSFGGYISAAVPKSETEDISPKRRIRSAGSTFEKLADCPRNTPEATEPAREAIRSQIRAAGLSSAPLTDAKTEDWVGIRATVPDHMPYCGPVPNWQSLRNACAPLATDANQALSHEVEFYDGLYCLTGLGSKGYQYGPLLGEYLAAMICDEPLPIPKPLIAKLHPARSMVRQIIRGEA